MCDRCSHSHFHAPRLNNSPRADNPCTLDHLRGTAEPGKFRLLPSVGFCATAAPVAPGRSRNLVSTQPNTRLFFFFSFFPRVFSLFFCWRRGLLLCQPASQPASAGITQQLHINGSRPEPRCSAADFPSSGTSAGVFGVQEWRRPPSVAMSSQRRHHMRRQLQHQAGKAGIC